MHVLRNMMSVALAALTAGGALRCRGGTDGLLLRTGPIHGGGAAVSVTVSVARVQVMELAASGYSYGQAVWGEPVLVDTNGTRVSLTSLKPESASVGWGRFSIDEGPDGRPLEVGGVVFAHGIFAHAESAVRYRLDGRFARFESRVGVNRTAGPRGAVVFEVRDEGAIATRRTLERLRRGLTRECLTSLGRVLADWPDAALAQRLAAFERDFDAMRAEVDAGTVSPGSKVAAFEEFVRAVRLRRLDGPLLFVRRHAYDSPHIYDDYLTWHPGGGIYVIENPADPQERQVVRTVIDAGTPGSPGEGVYRDPDLAFDARSLLFAFKGEPEGGTSIFEVGLDGRGLRRLTYPDRDCPCAEPPAGLFGRGHHDIAPCRLPDGRIAFLSTRTSGLVMCFNNFIATLHTMNGDGTDLRSISVNNVTEFDPTLLPDGRILFGRWEYVDKTALYMQSLWTCNPDGTGESAFFANNLAKPTAVLDARPVPGSARVIASLTPHNGQSVGAIATIDPRLGKNGLGAIVNFTPEYPTEMDQGLRRGPCDPWPLDEDSAIVADNAPEHGPHGVLELIDRFGFRFVIRREPDIACYSPMPVRPSTRPPVRPSMIEAGAPARFFVHDIYDGMPGVRRGEVKRLRVVETTSRVSGVPPGGRWWNQAFLVSWQGSYDVKRFLGTVPVEEDGSVCFEAPAGKALYFQALDGDGRLVQGMRTFVQAAPGVTRSCRGCHVADEDSAPVARGRPGAMARAARRLEPESWGGDRLDFPSMVRPVLDRRCVRCHGGADGIAADLDLSGGWTWAFDVGYESLIARGLVGFLNCNNGSVRTAELLPPRSHGSGAAPLAGLLMRRHAEPRDALTGPERDLLFAWMDGNANHRGTWDYTTNATCAAALAVREPLLAAMEKTGCLRCHARQIGRDWVNLQTPEWSRILRAPLAAGTNGHGLAWCRERPARPPAFPMIDQHVQPPDVFRPTPWTPRDASGAPAVSFADVSAGGYVTLLDVIREARAKALAAPRADMPGAEASTVRGRFRELPSLAPPAPSGT